MANLAHQGSRVMSPLLPEELMFVRLERHVPGNMTVAPVPQVVHLHKMVVAVVVVGSRLQIGSYPTLNRTTTV